MVRELNKLEAVYLSNSSFQFTHTYTYTYIYTHTHISESCSLHKGVQLKERMKDKIKFPLYWPSISLWFKVCLPSIRSAFWYEPSCTWGFASIQRETVFSNYHNSAVYSRLTLFSSTPHIIDDKNDYWYANDTSPLATQIMNIFYKMYCDVHMLGEIS